jgi:hypothetical protein
MENNSNITEVDLTLKGPEELEDSFKKIIPDIGNKKYSPDADREKIRGQVTLGLFSFMIIEIIFLFGLYVFLKTPISDLKDLSILLLSPVITLTGTSFGFYFASKI